MASAVTPAAARLSPTPSSIVSMKKLYLLDAYALIFRAYYALIRSPRINSKGRNTSAVYGFVNTLEDILKKEQPDYVGIAFDPSGPTFRHEAYPAYKAQREATPEDIRWAVPVIKDIIRAYGIPILEVAGYEADDVIGTLARQGAAAGLDVHLVTPDKDYAQLVGPHITMERPHHGGGGFDSLGPQEVCAKYGLTATSQVVDLLGLMGDTADNIPGCPGVGEKTAVKLISQFGSIDELLRRTGELKGALRKKVEENVEQIRFSKFLVTICTDVPISLDLEALRRRESDKAALRPLYENLEFRSFLQRMQTEEAQPLNDANEWGPLFASLPDEEAGEEKETTHERLCDVAHNYHFVDTEEAARGLCSILLTKEIVGIDTETTSVDAMRAELVGMSFATPDGEAWYVAVPRETVEARRRVDALRPFFEKEDQLKVGQNMKYDLLVLSHYDVEVKGRLFDTLLAHYLVQPELRHGLDYLAEIYLHYDTIHIEELIGPKGRGQKNMRDVEPQAVTDYACEDAHVALRLYPLLLKELEENGLMRVFSEIEMPLMPVLMRMERHGVRLDTDALAQTGEQFRRRLVELEDEIYRLAGHSFMLTSPRQVGEVLFGELQLSEKARKTKSGQYQTGEEVLEALRHKHPIVGKILAHRALKKLLSTYIDALPKLINPVTGHLHTSFNQAVTATGRLSSSNPNLQNIPVRGEDGREIRKAFVPEEGEIFFSADYSQIELRLMAHLSGDTNLVADFREGKDIHAATAARIFHKDLTDISRDERRKAKTANFGIIYGISAFGLAERMDVTRTEAKELIDSYFATYPGVKTYMEHSVEEARKSGYIVTAFGRRRYLADINSRNAVVRGYAERNAVNAPIQGTAADIIKVAMIRIDQRLRSEGFHATMRLQVHDELNFSVPPAELESVRRIVVDEMEKAYCLSVPLIADCGTGNNWLEAH